MWRLLRVWSCCKLNIWTVFWTVHCISAYYCAHTLHTHSHTHEYLAQRRVIWGAPHVTRLKKLKFSTLTHECRASWSNVCLISSPWLYIIRCIRQKASWWLIHRATARIRESASEKELRSHFFQRGAFKVLRFLGERTQAADINSVMEWPHLLEKAWMNRNGKNWASLLQSRSFFVFCFFWLSAWISLPRHIIKWLIQRGADPRGPANVRTKAVGDTREMSESIGNVL